jgi:anti-sigma B factor antagonist
MSVETIEGARPIVKAAGEIDLSNIDEVRGAIDSAIERSPKGFVIDLSDVVYIDSAGVAVVISAYRRTIKIGGMLAVVRPISVGVRRVLELIGLRMLPGIAVTDDVPAAQEALSAQPPKSSI